MKKRTAIISGLILLAAVASANDSNTGPARAGRAHTHTGGADSPQLDHGTFGGLDDNDHSAIYYSKAQSDANYLSGSHANLTTGTHGATGAIVDTSSSQTLTNKTITSSDIYGLKVGIPANINCTATSETELYSWAFPGSSATYPTGVLGTEGAVLFSVLIDTSLVNGAGNIRLRISNTRGPGITGTQIGYQFIPQNAKSFYSVHLWSNNHSASAQMGAYTLATGTNSNNALNAATIDTTQPWVMSLSGWVANGADNMDIKQAFYTVLRPNL